jgi:inner membrane protein
MTAPNHVAGGLVFTGTMLSFYSVNLFSNPFYLLACLVFSLLPDVDTPKTAVGKTVYPIAIFLNRRFGHRTLTHSLLFLAFILMFLVLSVRLFEFDSNYVKIAIFAFLSHLILDMLTIQGVPLFYPFRRNPCVLPADPKFRLTTADTKQELVLFTVLVLLGFTMLPLFQHGFWTSYNRQFATISHCDRENTNSANWIKCEYDYIKNNTKFNGSAFILESNDNTLELFDGKKVFKISTEDKAVRVNSVKPLDSGIPKRYNELNFMNVEIDSVNSILNDRVCSGLLQSNYNVKYVDRGITHHTNFIKFANSYDFIVLGALDTAKYDLYNELERVQARIEKDSLTQLEKYSKFRRMKAKQFKLTYQITETPEHDLYTKNKLQKELIDVTNKLDAFELKSLSIDVVLLRERERLKKELKKDNPVLFSGYVTYCIFEVNNTFALRENTYK